MAKFDWKSALKVGAQLADELTANSAVRRDIDLARGAAVNLLLASSFPLQNGLRAWKGAETLMGRARLALEDEKIRAWLVAWAEMPRPLKAVPKGLQ